MRSKQGYVEELTAGSTVGGVTAGTDLTGMTIYDVFNMLFNPYLPPSFTSFAITGQSQTLEIGDSIAAGSKTFTWSTSNSINVEPDSIFITGELGSIVSNEPNTGSYIYNLPTPITKTIPEQTSVFTITGTNTNSGSFSRTFTVIWKAYLYTGKSTLTSLIDDDAVALSTSSLGGSPFGTKSFASGPGYIYYVYPDTFANISTMKDVATNLDVPFLHLSDITIVNGFSVSTTYKVFRTLNQLNGAITLITT